MTDPTSVSAHDPVRLAKRVVEQLHCSRREAELYIEGGWVLVDGLVVDEPQFMVQQQTVSLAADAELRPVEPATILLHTPVLTSSGPWPLSATSLVTPATRWGEDTSGLRTLKRHFARLRSPMPLEREASGLLVLTQDGRVERRLSEDAERIEQEYIVDVAGVLVEGGLERLNRGMRYQSQDHVPGKVQAPKKVQVPQKVQALQPCKVSWQNETRLRFAIKAVQPGQIGQMCAEVGLTVLALRRIRIGRIPLGRMPPGTWRYLPADERF